VTWLIHVCDMTHSCVWRYSFKCVTWLIHVCDMTHSCMWHDSFMFATWLVRTGFRLKALDQVCGMTHSWRGHEVSACKTSLILMCDLTHSYVWQDFFFMCDMAHSHVWHDSFYVWQSVLWVIKSGTRLVHMRDISPFMLWDMTRPYGRPPREVCRDSLVCVTWIIYTWRVTHLYGHPPRGLCCDSFICVSWVMSRLHVFDMSHLHMYMHMYIHMYIYIYLYKYIYIYIHICTYIHIYSHMYTRIYYIKDFVCLYVHTTRWLAHAHKTTQSSRLIACWPVVAFTYIHTYIHICIHVHMCNTYTCLYRPGR